MAANNVSQIYVSIHSTGEEPNDTGQVVWRILIQSSKSSSLFHHAKKPQSTIYDQRNDNIEPRSFTKEDQATQLLRVLIGEASSKDIFTEVRTIFAQLSGDATAQHLIKTLQQTGLIKKFDLQMFTTIVDDRLKIVLRHSRRRGPEEMNYLFYCSTPASARSMAGNVNGSDYFMSAYEEPVKKSKMGFWLSYPQAPYRTAESRDPYGGLM